VRHEYLFWNVLIGKWNGISTLRELDMTTREGEYRGSKFRRRMREPDAWEIKRSRSRKGGGGMIQE
jgi:hypothetical protein